MEAIETAFMSRSERSSKPARRSAFPIPSAAAARRTYLDEARRLAEAALAEDIGAGDVTSGLFGPEERGEAFFLAKEDGVASGMELVRAVFAALEPAARVAVRVGDGEAFRRGDTLAEVRGAVRTLLTGERVALNFLQRLSGVATLTRRFVDALGPGSSIAVLDTRKTTPLLRIVEKAAVVHGGGRNHRMRLDDMAMIKNNHIDRAGGVAEAVSALGETGFFRRKPSIPLCIEARTPQEALAAADAGADIVLLDNMTPAQAGRCAGQVAEHAAANGIPRPLIEISGGITLGRIGRYKGLPIDRISVGALTHSAPALDISLRMKLPPKPAF